MQEQLQRLLLVNAELRHKLAAVQTQLRAAQDREREREVPRQEAPELAKEREQGQTGEPGCEQRLEPERASPDSTVSAGGSQQPKPALRASGPRGRTGKLC